MAFFGSDTGMGGPMDRDYFTGGAPEKERVVSPTKNSTGDLGIGIKDIGMSLAVGPVPNVPAVGAKLRSGMKTMEIGFMGAGKGSGQSQTPEYYGKRQRQAFREMAKANEVNFTTHSSFGVQGLAGMDQQGNFSKASKNFSVQEIKRAIEFAGDVGQGGPVVVHTGEFQRSIADADWNQEGPDAGKFRMFEGEEDQAGVRVIDRRTGAVINEARKGMSVSRPEWFTVDKLPNNEYFDNGVKKKWDGRETVYVDYLGNKVEKTNRVPYFDEDEGTFKTRQYSWTDMEKEAEDMTSDFKQEYERWEGMSPEERNKSFWRERINRLKDVEKLKGKISQEEWNSFKIKPEEASVIAILETNAANAKGFASQQQARFDQHRREVVNNAIEINQKRQQLTQETDEAEIIKLRNEITNLTRSMEAHKNQMNYDSESAASQLSQAEEAIERIRHVQSAKTYALEEAFDAYAQAGLAAMKESERVQREKGLNLRKPITVAMENLFPEAYGSHPAELTNLIKGSRKKMEQYLTQFHGLNTKEAEERAKKHITATLDTGHINQWRKYWIGEGGEKERQKKTVEQKNKEFNKWLVDKVAWMQKEGVIGHIHLDDNYGYHDDHLAPGEGNAPIKEMIKALKDNGYDGELIVEPGADWTVDTSGFQSVMKTWNLFGSSVYGGGMGGVGSKPWGQVSYGWFGQTQPPYFTVGSYSPSEDWTLWSGVPLD